MQKQVEKWVKIPNMKGQYLISSLKRVKRLERVMIWNNKEKVLPEIIIKQTGQCIKIKGINYKVNDLMNLAGFKIDHIPNKKQKPIKKTYNKRIGFGINAIQINS